MPRIRTVKPEYAQHKKVRKVSRDARLLNIHLWNLADDEGRLQELPRWIIGEVFQADDDVTPATLLGWLAELEQVGLIVRYEVDDEQFIFCNDFNDHQSINKPRASLLPAPPAESERSGRTPVALPDDSRGEQGTGNRERNTPQPPEGEPAVADEVAEVFAYWQERLSKPDHKLTRERRRKIRARLDEGYTVADLKEAIDGIATSPFHRGQNDRDREYVGIELVFRNGSKVDEFRDLARKRRGKSKKRGQIARDLAEAA